LKILYIEDHPTQRDIIVKLLKKNKYQVTVAADGLDGIETAKTTMPDLILMDMHLPRVDGYEAIRILRNDPSTSHIPIISISAWASSKHKQRAYEVGASDYFTKPFEMEELVNAINKIAPSLMEHSAA
jgi:CheY-like chemotaxis protein